MGVGVGGRGVCRRCSAGVWGRGEEGCVWE